MWLDYIFECDWLIKLSDNKLSNNKLSNYKLSDNNLASELVENRTFFKPITSEEIVIFMINIIILKHLSFVLILFTLKTSGLQVIKR